MDKKRWTKRFEERRHHEGKLRRRYSRRPSEISGGEERAEQEGKVWPSVGVKDNKGRLKRV